MCKKTLFQSVILNSMDQGSLPGSLPATTTGKDGMDIRSAERNPGEQGMFDVHGFCLAPDESQRS
jgi:hypothetical protein